MDPSESNEREETEQHENEEQKADEQFSTQLQQQGEDHHVLSQFKSKYQVIDITVLDPQVKEQSFSKYAIYTIRGSDRLGAFEVQRRYNEFYSVREALFIRWPGCFIPKIPGKKSFQGNEPKVIEDRLKFLNAFCNRLSKLPHLFYSAEFNQIFLRSRETDVSKTLQSVTKSSSAELIQKYQVHFGQLQGKEIDSTLISNLNNFEVYLKKSVETLKHYKVFVKEMITNQDQLNQQILQLINQNLPDYERCCLRQYVNNNEDCLLILNNQINDTIQQKLKEGELFKSVNLQYFLDLIRLEIKDCKAFLQQLQIRNEYEQRRFKLEKSVKDIQIEYQNALQGKQSIKSMLQMNKNEDNKSKLNLQIQDTNNEIENLKVLIDVVSAILGFIELDEFRKEKHSTYKNIMNTVCEIEIQTISAQKQFWELIEQQSNKLIETLGH